MTTSRITIAAVLLGVLACCCAASAQVAPAPPLVATFSPAAPAQAPASLLDPAPRPLCGPVCWAWEGSTTPTEQGSGSTCAAATSSLTSQLDQIANAFCTQIAFGYCDLVETITTSCHVVSGVYQVQGYAKYGCRDTTC